MSPEHSDSDMRRAEKAPRIGATVVIRDRQIGPLLGILTAIDRNGRASVARAIGGTWTGPVEDLIV